MNHPLLFIAFKNMFASLCLQWLKSEWKFYI